MPLESTRTITTYGAAFKGWMTFRSPQLLVVFIALVIALRSSLASPGLADLIALAAGIAIWPFLEWFLHKYALHIKPIKLFRLTIDPDFSRRHRAHHGEPWRPELIVLPPYIHLTIGPALVAIAWFWVPDTALMLSGLIGFGLAALNYEWTHFIVHTRIHPKNGYYQGLFRAHRMHHFRNEKYWYGFTLTSVDRLLGTGPDPETTPRSDDCRDLGVKQTS